MALSQRELQAVKELKAQGYTSTEISGFIAAERTGAKSMLHKRMEQTQPEPQAQATPETAKPGMFSGVGDVIDTASQGVREAVLGQGENAGQNVLQRGLKATATAFGAVPKVALETALSVLPESARTATEAVGGVVSKGFKKLTGAIGSNESLQKWVRENPDATDQIIKVSQSLQSAGEIAGTIAGGQGTVVGTTKAATVVTNASKATAKAGGQALNATGEALSTAGNAVAGAARATGEAVAPATDIAKGLAQQTGDFIRRTAADARETAATNRTLESLPKPEADIRRIVPDARVIDQISSAPEAEVSVYKELVAQAKRKESDPTPNTDQPKVIAGREFLKPVDYLIKQRSSIGASLGETRKNLSTAKTVNTNGVFRSFRDYLTQSYQIKFDAQGQIVPGTGRLAQSDIREVQKIYDELYSKTFTSQTEIDQFLQRTFKEYDLRQAREMTFSDDVTRIAERARSEFRTLMPEEYNKQAEAYAQVLGTISKVTKLYGYKGDLAELATKDLKAGEIAGRLLGGASARPQEVIQEVLDTANAYGYTSDVDLNRLIYITDQLEDLYDITPSRSHTGSVTRGIDQSSVGVGADIATLNAGGLFNKAMNSKASRAEVQKAFEDYINSL